MAAASFRSAHGRLRRFPRIRGNDVMAKRCAVVLHRDSVVAKSLSVY
jgi:hypothetical protein